MDYFEFYQIPLAFQIDEAILKEKFYSFSKQYHPDFFVQESEEKQAEILELSTLNNKAFQALNSFYKRTEYILGLNNLLTEGDKYALPQDFLMEMMELNELLMEIELSEDSESIKDIENKVKVIEESLDALLLQHAKNYDRHIDQEKSLENIRDIFYRKKYLLRIRDSLAKIASRF